MADHFDTLGLTPAFALDAETLRRFYLEAQAREHPDRQADPKARLAAVQRSADINAAYRILSDPLARAEYLLARENIFVGSERDSVKPSQAALLESLELREELSVSDDPASLLPGIEQGVNESAARFAERFAAGEFSDAAQAAIRWRYMAKLRQEAAARIAAISRAAS